MAYNGSGTFSALSSFTSGTTISSSAMNALIADIASGLSNAVCKDGQSAITGQIAVAAGTVSAPGLTFSGDTNCGFYRIGADNIGLAIGGSKIMDFSSAGAANASGNKYDAFPSGTAIIFMQTSAPTGWTKSSSHNDKALRIVSGTASSGGTSPFSTVFGLTSTQSYALTTTDIPSHTHTGTTGGRSAAHNHTINYTTSASFGAGGGSAVTSIGSGGSSGTTVNDATDHTHSFTSDASGGSGGHSHAIELRVQYADVICATKDA